MFVIIDGYNLINLSNSLRHSERLSLEERRNRLIQRLAKHKKCSGHKIIIVFDGWISGSFTEERQIEKGIHVIYSKRGEKADEIIKRLAKRAMQEVIVVTSDREIAASVWKSGGVVFSSQEFESRLRLQATHLPYEKDATEDDDKKSLNTKKKGPAKRLSKRKRLIQRKLQKF